MSWFGELTVYRVLAGMLFELMALIVVVVQLLPRTVDKIEQNDLLLFSFALMTSPVSGIIIGSYSQGLLSLPWILLGVMANLICYGAVSLVLKLIGVITSLSQGNSASKKENNL